MAFLKIAIDKPISRMMNNRKALFYSEFTPHLFPQLFAVGNNLINCVRQELDGVAEWFICGNICSDNHS